MDEKKFLILLVKAKFSILKKTQKKILKRVKKENY